MLTAHRDMGEFMQEDELKVRWIFKCPRCKADCIQHAVSVARHVEPAHAVIFLRLVLLVQKKQPQTAPIQQIGEQAGRVLQDLPHGFALLWCCVVNLHALPLDPSADTLLFAQKVCHSLRPPANLHRRPSTHSSLAPSMVDKREDHRFRVQPAEQCCRLVAERR